MRNRLLTVSSLWIFVLFVAIATAFAQRGTPAGRTTGFTLFGDMDVTGKGSESRTLIFDVLLYARSGVLIDRQKVGNKGRYRFLNVPAGDYDIVIEFETAEIARSQIRLVGIPTDFRQDLTLEWKADTAAERVAKPT